MAVIRLAWRNVWRNRRRSLITIISIAFGLSLAIFFISMGDGMYKKLIDSAVRMNAGHITLQHPEYTEAPAVDLVISSVSRTTSALNRIEGIENVKPITICQAVVSSGSGSSGAGMIGVDPEVERELSPVAAGIEKGRYIENDDQRGVVIGSAMAKRLNLRQKSKVVITTNDIHGELVNEMLRVTGIFNTGMEEVDGFLVQVPIATSRRILGMTAENATRIGVIVDSPDNIERILYDIRQTVGNEAALPWQEILPDLAGFMAVDLGSNYVFQGIIIFLISFTILNTVLMSVLERGREFATLLAIGTSVSSLRILVLCETTIIGILGVLAGTAIGGGASVYFGIFGLDMRSIFGDDLTITGFAVDPIIYNHVTPWLLTWLGGAVLMITLLIGIYPSVRAASADLPAMLRSR